MNRQLFNANKTAVILLAGNALLVAVLAAESYFDARHRERFEQDLQQEHSGKLFDKLPGGEITLGSQDDYLDIVNRPLFLEGRLPVANAGEPLQKQTSASAVRGDFAFSLTGVVLMPDSILALLTDKSGKHFRVKQGESIQGWQIENVREDKVVITSGAQRRELLLREFKPGKQAPIMPKASVPPATQGTAPPAAPRVENGQTPVPAPAVEDSEQGSVLPGSSESENADPDVEDQ